MKTSPEPFIKCVGGKRALLPAIRSHAPRWAPSYFEPFLGGGAVFFGLLDAKRICTEAGLCVLSDCDGDLIDLYDAVKGSLRRLMSAYAKIAAPAVDAPETAYYRERDLWNAGRRTPARNLFLRMHCFNGLWRTATNGEMNASWNRAKVRALDEGRLQAASQALQCAQLFDQDFRAIDSLVEKGALVYLDPPYLDTWTDYHETRWTEADFVELLQLAQAWTRKGAHVLLSHTDSERVRLLLLRYWPEAVVHIMYARHRVSRDPDSRGDVREILART